MSKLRVIKERKESHQQEDQDLRGLGNTTLLKNTHIEPYLTFENKSLNFQSSMDKILSQFNGKIVKKTDQHTVITTQPQGNHKADALVLFHMSIYLFKNNLAQSIHLREINWLHAELQNAIHDKLTLETHYEMPTHHEHGVHLSSMFSHTLHQVGYLEKASDEITHLHEKDILHIITQIKSSAQSAHRRNTRSA